MDTLPYNIVINILSYITFNIDDDIKLSFYVFRFKLDVTKKLFYTPTINYHAKIIKQSHIEMFKYAQNVSTYNEDIIKYLTNNVKCLAVWTGKPDKKKYIIPKSVEQYIPDNKYWKSEYFCDILPNLKRIQLCICSIPKKHYKVMFKGMKKIMKLQFCECGCGGNRDVKYDDDLLQSLTYIDELHPTSFMTNKAFMNKNLTINKLILNDHTNLTEELNKGLKQPINKVICISHPAFNVKDYKFKKILVDKTSRYDYLISYIEIREKSLPYTPSNWSY